MTMTGKPYDKYRSDVFELIPQWVKDLVDAGTIIHGGETTVSKPSKMVGRRCLSISLRASSLADVVEREAKFEGWVPHGYRKWSDSDAGTITFVRIEDKPDWDAWNNRI